MSFNASPVPQYPLGNQGMQSNPYWQIMSTLQPLISENYHLKGELHSAHELISQIAYDNYRKKDKTPRKIERNIQTQEWYCQERDSERIVNIGKLSMKECFVVNLHEDKSCDALYCILEDANGIHVVVIPFKDVRKRNIMQYLFFYRKDPDCKDRYLIDAFYLVLHKYTNPKFLTIPKKVGWNYMEDNGLLFASADSMDCYLREYYAEDIKERHLVKSDRALSDIAKEYAEVLPESWKIKMLVVMRVASLLLNFFAKKGLEPKQFFVLEPENEPCAELLIALTKTKNYESTTTCSLTKPPTVILSELAQTNDGVALFRDISFIEDTKKLNMGVRQLVDDIKNANGEEDKSRHVITIISDNPANLPDEAPVYYLNFNGQGLFGIEMIRRLQRLSGEFDFALIQSIVSDPKNNVKKIDDALEELVGVSVSVANSERINTMKIMLVTANLLSEYKIVNDEEIQHIREWLQNNEEYGESSSLKIVNCFAQVFNELLQTEKLRVVSQDGPPYYEQDGRTVFVDKDCINFEAKIINRYILPRMHQGTQNRNKLLSALGECGKLHSTNNYQRYLDVAVSEYEHMSVRVYSVFKSILDEKSRVILNDLVNDDYYFSIEDILSENFVPLLCNGSSTKIAGVQITSETDENFHMHVSGMSRSGKTHFLAQQAVFRSYVGERVVIFDNSGSFTKKELNRFFPQAVIDKYISFIDVESDGMPVDLFSLDNCTTPSRKRDRILDILSAAAKGFGSAQEEILKKELMKMLRGKIEQTSITVTEILEGLCKVFQKEERIREKIEDVLEEVKDSIISFNGWSQCLEAHKNVIVISLGDDSYHKDSRLIDMLLATLYNYKVYDEEQRLTIIIDELADLNMTKDGPINTILRKGAKHNLHMLLASQEYSADKDGLGRIIGHTGTRVFFRPKDECIKEIPVKIDKASLRMLEQGYCFIDGGFYSKGKGSNNQAVIQGKVADFIATPYYKKEFLTLPVMEDSLSSAFVEEKLAVPNQYVVIPSSNTSSTEEISTSSEVNACSSVTVEEKNAVLEKPKFCHPPANPITRFKEHKRSAKTSSDNAKSTIDRFNWK